MSSVIKSVKKINADTIEISLVTERTYRYTGIEDIDSLLSEFMGAESQGRYYNQYIKGQYFCIKVDEEKAPREHEEDKEIKTDIRVADMVADLEKGETVVAFGTREELEELLEVLSVTTTISFKAERILANFDYMTATEHYYNGIVLVDGIIQLIATHLVPSNVKIKPINNYHTHVLTIVKRTRQEGLIITPLESKSEQEESYDITKEQEKELSTTTYQEEHLDNEVKEKDLVNITLSDLLNLKDDSQKALETLSKDINLKGQADIIRNYIKALENKIKL